MLFRKVALAPQVLEAMPYMSALSLGKSEAKATVLRVGTTGEDGFEILGPSSLLHEVAAALLQTPLVRPAGVYCLDILRMEAGKGPKRICVVAETLVYKNIFHKPYLQMSVNDPGFLSQNTKVTGGTSPTNEAGLPRIGTDVASGLHSPVRAALSWTLDQGKMRSHLMPQARRSHSSELVPIQSLVVAEVRLAEAFLPAGEGDRPLVFQILSSPSSSSV